MSSVAIYRERAIIVSASGVGVTRTFEAVTPNTVGDVAERLRAPILVSPTEDALRRTTRPNRKAPALLLGLLENHRKGGTKRVPIQYAYTGVFGIRFRHLADGGIIIANFQNVSAFARGQIGIGIKLRFLKDGLRRSAILGFFPQWMQPRRQRRPLGPRW